MLNALGQLGSIPWTYRAWAYLFSQSYRDEMRSIWARRGALYKVLDCGLSLLFMGLEILLVAGITLKLMPHL